MRSVLTCLGVSVLILLAWGLIVLASAGGENGLRFNKGADYFLTQQLKWLALSIPCFCVALKFDYHKWKELPWLTIAAYVFVALLMVWALFCREVNGSHRWIIVGSARLLQPSELAKLLSIIVTAVFIDRLGWAIGKFLRGALCAALIVGVLMGLAVAEPDFGATMVIGLTAAVLFLVGGMKIVHMLALGAMGGLAIGVLLIFNPNRMNRIFSWAKSSWVGELFGFAATADAVVLSAKEQAAAHQADMALVAIRNGGLTGVGMNKSMQKLRYLPESHTDFIFAIGAEEWGLIFSLSLLALFAVFFVCGMIISARAPDRLGRLIAFGVTFLIFFQVLFNIGVVTKCLPTKGLAFPFISYGGTNLLSAVVAVGILFNIGLQIELPKSRPRSTI